MHPDYYDYKRKNLKKFGQIFSRYDNKPRNRKTSF